MHTWSHSINGILRKKRKQKNNTVSYRTNAIRIALDTEKP